MRLGILFALGVLGVIIFQQVFFGLDGDLRNSLLWIPMYILPLGIWESTREKGIW